MENDGWIYRLALGLMPGITPRVARQLSELAGGCEPLFTGAIVSDFPVAETVKKQFSLSGREAALRRAEIEYAFVRKNKISLLFYTDAGYPLRLRECEDAPLYLYFKGRADLNAVRVVSVVGTRHATVYGRDFCQTFMRELSCLFPDVLIVSGLAYGIDIAAHRAALEYGLPTVGVLAHGLQMIYPESHRHTAIAMLENGGLLTEYSSQQKVYKMNFVSRNRIVAGMADALLVVESAEKGGALITADLANGYHKDVFALPGRVGDPFSCGCNRLIASNQAALLSSASDFVSQMCWEVPEKGRAVQPSLFPLLDLNDEERSIVTILDEYGECHVNQLALHSGFSTARLLALLLDLEFKNVIVAFPGGMYRKKG